MTNAQRQSPRYLTRRIVAAKNVLGNPLATDVQRHGARCRLNRAVEILRHLPAIPQMSRAKREQLLGVEKQVEAAA